LSPMSGGSQRDPDIDELSSVARRVADLLAGRYGERPRPGETQIDMVGTLDLRPLGRSGVPPGDLWAVDGGQGLVLDAKCFALYATRSAVVRWDVEAQASLLEQEGELRLDLLSSGRLIDPEPSPWLSHVDGREVDVNLLRECQEWATLEEVLDQAVPGALVLLDGDLMADWRLPDSWVADILSKATQKGVALVGVTKHTSLSWRGAPVVGVLESAASTDLGSRARWWAPLGRFGSGPAEGTQVVVARLDPDARFAFRVDLPQGSDPEELLGKLCWVCEDAAFPGYPHPLATADRLAACPPWLCEELRQQIDEHLDALGVDPSLRESAFSDRHRLLERY